jgi:hypothetical protein
VSALTLRDCRRLMSRGRWPMTTEADAIVRAIGWGDDAMRTLDRLISRYGAGAVAFDILYEADSVFVEVEEIEEADRTDHEIGEDAPVSDGAHIDADADTHGGDGNSGECEHAAERAAEGRDASDSACHSSATGDTPDGRERDAASDDASNGGTLELDDSSAQAGKPTDQGDDGADKVTEGMGSHPTDGHSTDADEEPDGDRCPAKGDVEAVDGNMREPQASDGDAGAPEADSQGASGGCVVRVSPSLARVTEVARIARALSRLMADAARPEPSPLWDGKRVVRELVTRQARLHRMRRDVPAIKGLLVLYDVSGSCEWIAARTWGIAEALAKRYSAFYAAQTPAAGAAEGSISPASIICRDAYRLARLAPIIGGGHGDDVSGWRRIEAAGISHILVFGDAHGTAGYRAAAEAGIRVLWANPNARIAPIDTAWCDYTFIADGDIAAAVETLARRK